MVLFRFSPRFGLLPVARAFANSQEATDELAGARRSVRNQIVASSLRLALRAAEHAGQRKSEWSSCKHPPFRRFPKFDLRAALYLFYRRGRFLSTPFPFVRMLEILHRGGTRNSIRSRCGPRLPFPSLRHKRAWRCSFQSLSAPNAELSFGLLKGSRSAFLCFAFSLCFRFQVTLPSIPLH